ncbi:unnamed protein product, partial [Symbiodinium necroappetens]
PRARDAPPRKDLCRGGSAAHAAGGSTPAPPVSGLGTFRPSAAACSEELKRSFAAWASEESGLSAEALSTLLRLLCPRGSEAEQQTVVAETMAATAGPLRKVVSADEFVEKLLLFGSEADRRAEAAER